MKEDGYIIIIVKYIFEHIYITTTSTITTFKKKILCKLKRSSNKKKIEFQS